MILLLTDQLVAMDTQTLELMCRYTCCKATQSVSTYSLITNKPFDEQYKLTHVNYDITQLLNLRPGGYVLMCRSKMCAQLHACKCRLGTLASYTGMLICVVQRYVT